MQSKVTLLLDNNFSELNAEVQKAVYQEFYNLVYGAIMYIVKDHGNTEDIIQESFLKVIKNLPTADSESKLRAWIRMVVKNTAYNYLRGVKKTRNELNTEFILIYDSVSCTTDFNLLEKEVELKVIVEVLNRCLRKLRPEYRILVEMRWKQGMSYKEMACFMKTNEQTVKYKLYRARKLVKKNFFELWGDTL